MTTAGTGTSVAAPPTGKARSRRRSMILAMAAVVGPGLIAGLSDDDPAGITTYSVLGAQHGYRTVSYTHLTLPTIYSV